MYSGAKVLITGHSGFKGSWLSMVLQKLGAEIYGYSKDIPTSPSNFEACGLRDNLSVSVEDADIANFKKLSRFVSSVQPDFIFHLAAQPLVSVAYEDPLLTWTSNLIGSINLLESLKSFGKPCTLVMITSDKCYENVEWVWGYRECDRLGGADPYSASKGATEIAIRSYLRSYFPKDGLVRIGIGRAGNVIGGGDWARDRLIPDFARAWSKNEVVNIRNPNSTRPWQHVLEPLSGYLLIGANLAVSSELHGEAFNFGPGTDANFTVMDVANGMSKYWNCVQWTVNAGSEDNGFHEAGLLKLNCDKAYSMMGWKPTWSFEETIMNTALWYKAYYEDNKCAKSVTDVQINSFIGA